MSRQYPAGAHPDPRIANLPKWAQQLITHQERRIEELTAVVSPPVREAEVNVWCISMLDGGYLPLSTADEVMLCPQGADGQPQRGKGFAVTLTRDGSLRVLADDSVMLGLGSSNMFTVHFTR